jgi:hypothetical protein
MTINRVDVSAVPTTVCSEFDSTVMTLAELDHETEMGEREALRDERARMEWAGEAKLAAMSDAADLRLAAGIVGGVLSCVSAVAGGVAGGAASGTSDKAWGTAIGGGADGVSSALTAGLEFVAGDADRRAESTSMAMDRARSRADEARADRDAIAGDRDQRTQTLGTIVSEARRTEEAATRA